MDPVSITRQEIASLVASLERADACFKKDGASAQLTVSGNRLSIRQAESDPASQEINNQSRLALLSGLFDSVSERSLHNVALALFGQDVEAHQRVSGKPLTARTLKLIDLGITMGECDKEKKETFVDFLNTVHEFSSTLARTFAQKFTANVYGTIYEQLENDFVDEAIALVKEKGVDVLSDSGSFVRLVENRVFAKNASLFEQMEEASKIMSNESLSAFFKDIVDPIGLPDESRDELANRYKSMVRETLVRQIAQDGVSTEALSKAKAEIASFNALLLDSVKQFEKTFNASDAVNLPESLQRALEDKLGDDLLRKVTQAYENPGFGKNSVDKLLNGYQEEEGILPGSERQIKLVNKAYATTIDAVEKMLNALSESRNADVRGQILAFIDKKFEEIVRQGDIPGKDDELAKRVTEDVTKAFADMFGSSKVCFELKQGAGDLVDSVVKEHLRDAPDLNAPILKEKLVQWVGKHYDDRLARLGIGETMNEKTERDAAAQTLAKLCGKLFDDIGELRAQKERVVASLTSDSGLSKRIGAKFDEMIGNQLDLSDPEKLSLKFNGADVATISDLATRFRDALGDVFIVEIFRAEEVRVRNPVADDVSRLKLNGGNRSEEVRKGNPLADDSISFKLDDVDVSRMNEKLLSDIEKKAEGVRREKIKTAFGRDRAELAQVDKTGLSSKQLQDELAEACQTELPNDAKFFESGHPYKHDAIRSVPRLALQKRVLGSMRVLDLLSAQGPLVADVKRNENVKGMSAALVRALKALHDKFETAISTPIGDSNNREAQFLSFFDEFHESLGKIEADAEVKKHAAALVDCLNAAEKAVESSADPSKELTALIGAINNLSAAMGKKIDAAKDAALEKTLTERFTQQQQTLLKFFLKNSREMLNMATVSLRLTSLGFTVEEALGMSVEELMRLAEVKFCGSEITSSDECWVANLLVRLKDGSLPLGEMRPGRIILLKSLLHAKFSKADPGQGFDTFDALEVYRALAKNGLLTERLEKLAEKKDEDGGTKLGRELVETLGEVLSLLYPLNHASTDNIVVLGEQLFGMDVLDFAQKLVAKDEAAVQLMQDLKQGSLANPLEKVAGTAKEVLTFFKADRSASEFFSQEAIKDAGVSATDLLGQLRQLEERSVSARPGDAVSVAFEFGTDVPVRLKVKDGLFRIVFTVEGKPCPLACPFDVGTFADGLEKAVVSNVGTFGVEAVRQILNGAVAKSTLRARELAQTVIQAQSGISVAKLSHVSSAAVCELANRLLDLTDETDRVRAVEAVVGQDNLKVNSANVEELREHVEGQGSAVDEAVVLPETMKVGSRNSDSLREFAVELLQNVQGLPWQDAKTQMRKLLADRKDVFITLSSNQERMEAFAIGTGDYQDESLANAMKSILKSLRLGCGKGEGDALSSADIDRALQSANFNRDLSELVNEIGQAQESCIAKLQTLFGKKFAGALANAAPNSASIEMQTLQQLAGADTFDVGSGYGRFLKSTFETYFTSLDGVDGKTFLASVIRQTGPNATPKEVMTAMVKAAGPVFQKLIQGVPENALPADLRSIVACSKSSLAPIPPEVVQAKLFSLVERSNGRIQSIEVKRSLGAASVGEALLCVIKTKDNPFGEECVVKMLRPDVQPRSQREYAVLSKIAGDVDGSGSMKAAFDARFQGILEELDFTLEAENVERGRIYRPDAVPGASKMVTSMSMHSLASPTSDLLILKKAEGTTFERFVRSSNEIIESIVQKFEKRADDAVSYKNGTGMQKIKAGQELVGVYRDLLSRQRQLVKFASRWTEEAIFNSGVFHGDLHGGNIMTSEKLLTAIDFGNVSALSESQRNSLMSIIAACAINAPSSLIECYKAMLSPEGRGLLETEQGKKDLEAFKAEVAAILAKGGVEDAPLRLSAVIRRLEKYGFEIPAPLFNFTQSLTRLLDTLNSVNVVLLRIKAVLSDISFDDAQYDEDGVNKENPFDASAYLLRQIQSGKILDGVDVANFVEETFSKEKLEQILGPYLDSEEKFNKLIGLLDEVLYPASVATGKKTGSVMNHPTLKLSIAAFREKPNCFGDDKAKHAFLYEMSRMLTDRIGGALEGIKSLSEKFESPQDYGQALAQLISNHQQDITGRASGALLLAAANFQFLHASSAERISDDLEKADGAAKKWIDGNGRLSHTDGERIKVVVRELLSFHDSDFKKEGFSVFSKNWSTNAQKRKSLLKKVSANLKWLDRRLPQLGFPAGDGDYQKAVRDFAIYFMGQLNGVGISFGTNNAEKHENLTEANFQTLLNEAKSMADANQIDPRVEDVLRSWRTDAVNSSAESV